VIMGARMEEQCLSSDIGRASRSHCLLGESWISLSISSSVAGAKALKSEGGVGGEG